MKGVATVTALPQAAAPQRAGDATMELMAHARFGVESQDDSLQAIHAKIMIVDDEPLNIDVLQEFLGEAGYSRFVSTSESRRALSMLVSERPDVLLLDLMMPELDGFEILSQMRADRALRHIPVIILTASSDPAHKLKALGLGATDFLGKPVDSSELVLRLRNTLAAKAYQDRLADFDALTELPNRKKHAEHLDWALGYAKRQGTVGAMLHVGLDRFKQINEAYGPATGDHVLQEVAKRLHHCVRTYQLDTQAANLALAPALSRLGNDEFSVLLPAITEEAAAVSMAHRVLEQIALPHHVNGQEIFLTCSIGIATFAQDSPGMEGILQAAGAAMHHAKRQGMSRIHVYSEALNANSRYRLSLENDLRKALERDEMRLFYQPKFDVESGRLTGAEALLRWQHPERGFVGPQDFIPAAEESGLIVPLGNWVLEAACRQINAWQEAGLEPPRISVNVSSHQFRDHHLADTVRRALDLNGVPPHLLTLEITESVIMENAQQNLDELGKIKATGVKLSIDDFGTGYSSLSYLMRFPLDELKIDRSFLAPIGNPGNRGSIVVAVIAIARSLGLNVVAEGVENQKQLDFLKAHHCDECQGFLFSKPVPADQFGAMLPRVAPPLRISLAL